MITKGRIAAKNTLIDHFQTLNFKDFKETVNDKNDTPSEPIEKKNNKFDTLNSEIGEKEVQSTINNLKQKKSPGYDRITNEMLQCTSPQGIKLITNFLIQF